MAQVATAQDPVHLADRVTNPNTKPNTRQGNHMTPLAAITWYLAIWAIGALSGVAIYGAVTNAR